MWSDPAATYGRGDERGGLEMLSAPYREGAVAERMRFRTAAEIEAETPTEPEWIAKPWVARRAVTAVDGKPKVAGKTTWVARQVRCVLTGKPFMGKPTKRTPVVYITEEADATFRQALDRAHLLGRTDLHVLYRRDTWGVSWPEIVKAAVEKCEAVGAELLVVDTIAPFAGLRADKENNAGDQQQAFEPLAWARDQGLAVIVIRHERKSSGDVGDSARGSNAFTAAADVIISIRRPEGKCKPTIREVHALSRFSETPDRLVVELTADGYDIRDSAAVSVDQAEQAILDNISTSPFQAFDLRDVTAVAGVGRSTTQKAIANLLATGLLKAIGGGVKGDPHRYYRQIHSATTPTSTGAESIPANDEADA